MTSCGVRSFPVLLGLCLLYVGSSMAQGYEDQGREDDRYQHAIRTLEHLVETRKGLNALRAVIKGIDSDLLETQKRWSSCAIGLGMAGYQCHLQTLHDDSDTKDWVATNLLSPGKRAQLGAIGTRQEATRKVKDLSRKRKGLEVMKKLVDQMDGDIATEQKRTCAVNLGGHCATESAASLADQWHYLNSPLSPGRKRRDTRLYQRLINGKLFEE